MQARRHRDVLRQQWQQYGSTTLAVAAVLVRSTEQGVPPVQPAPQPPCFETTCTLTPLHATPTAGLGPVHS